MAEEQNKDRLNPLYIEWGDVPGRKDRAYIFEYTKDGDRITEHDYSTGNEITSIKVKNHFPKARENFECSKHIDDINSQGDFMIKLLLQDEAGVFDGGIAREFRFRLGLSQRGLAKLIGMSSTTRICEYERGFRSPKNPLLWSGVRKYILWLKEEGYNPFRL